MLRLALLAWLSWSYIRIPYSHGFAVRSLRNGLRKAIRRPFVTASQEGVQTQAIDEATTTKKTDDDFIKETFESSLPPVAKGRAAAKGSEPTNAQQPLAHARPFPIGMVVDQEEIKQALLLATVNPRMGGVVISGGRGTGKSVMARALHRLVPPTIEIVKDSSYNVDPSGKGGIDSVLLEQLGKSRKTLADMETEMVPTPFVNIPLNVMEDSLIGTVDLELSLQMGKTMFSPGLLAKAHRGILYVDEINLLDEEAANVLLNVISDGYVNVEREGLSVRYPCKPLLVATFNPEEGELREHLLDRIAVSLSADATPLTVDERVTAVDNVIGFSGGTEKQLSEEAGEALQRAEAEEVKLQEAVIAARSRLDDVVIDSSQILYLCEEATRAGCEGQRAEIFATEIAKTSAALNGRTTVNADDLRTAVMLAIVPRAIFLTELTTGEEVEETTPSTPSPPQTSYQPLPPPNERKEERDESTDDEETKEEEADQEDIVDQNAEEEEEEDESTPDEQLEIPQEFMFGVKSTPIDPKLLKFAKWSRRGRAGKRSRIFSLERGRYVKPIFPKGNKKGKLAVGSTLRAAAPYQVFRRERAKGTSKEGKLVYIDKDDFRIKKMARKAGSLVIFLVDASGSMALNRMNAAKGAAISLLEEAYKCRDKICLIAFHGERSEVLVPPTKSTTLTKNRLEAMPCGGGSPLTHGLMTAMRTGLNTMKIKRDVSRVIIVCITDGRANIPLSISLGEGWDPTCDPESKEGLPSRKYLKEEVLVCAKTLGELPEFNLLVVDTEDQFVGTGMARELAIAARGNYHHIIEAETSVVTNIAKSGLEAFRNAQVARE